MREKHTEPMGGAGKTTQADEISKAHALHLPLCRPNTQGPDR